jgi:branched-subunit amino acid aminotransferase/4-amino-4-deoxychorismate lyase
MSVFETIAVVAASAIASGGASGALAACDGGLRGAAAGHRGIRIYEALDRPASVLFHGGSGRSSDPFVGKLYALFELAEMGWNLPALRVMSSAAPYLPRPGGWKSGNYWQNVEAMGAAQRAGCGEALLFNPAGMLVGASMANVFLQIDGMWVTPALETGARDGAVREWVLEHFPVEEGIPGSLDTARCTAAFLTNSRMGIRSVAELDGRPLVDAAADIQQKYFDEIFAA